MARLKDQDERTAAHGPVDLLWSSGIIIQATLRDQHQPVQGGLGPVQVAEPPTDIEARLDAIERKLDRVLYELGQAKADSTRTHFTVEEAARALGKTTFSVREWCRLGRINATKRAERRGGAEMWDISAAEVDRIRNEGLLPVDPARNRV